jgi:hypothetical protein
VDLLNKILELDSVYEGEGQQPGGFQTSDPKEAIREVVRRMFPGVNATIPISENLQLNLGPNINEISAGGQFDVGGGELSIGGGMSGDDKAFGINFRKEFSNGSLSEEYYGKSQLAYQKAVEDGFQGTYEEYLRLISPTKSFADGGRAAFKYAGPVSFEKLIKPKKYEGNRFSKKMPAGTFTMRLYEGLDADGNRIEKTYVGTKKELKKIFDKKNKSRVKGDLPTLKDGEVYQIRQGKNKGKFAIRMPKEDKYTFYDTKAQAIKHRLDYLRDPANAIGGARNVNIKPPKGFVTGQDMLKEARKKGITVSENRQASNFADNFGFPKTTLKGKTFYDISKLSDPKEVDRILLAQVRSGAGSKLAKEKFPVKTKTELQKPRLTAIEEKFGVKKDSPLAGKKKLKVDMGHAGNIFSKFSDELITLDKLTYTPSQINEILGQKGGVDDKIRAIQNSQFKVINKMNDADAAKYMDNNKIPYNKASSNFKQQLLSKSDATLTRLVLDSGGEKVARLSDGTTFGGSFLKNPVDRFDMYKGVTEKDFVNFRKQYLTNEGNLKPNVLTDEAKKTKIKLTDTDDFTNIIKQDLPDADKKNLIDLKIFEDNRIASMQSASANELRPLANIGCPNKKADGGRVNFANGEDLVACAIKGAEKLQNTDPKKLDGLAKSNIKTLTKTASGARFLKNVLGPGALAFEGLFALPFAALDFAEGRAGSDILKNALSLGLMDSKLRQDELKEFFAGAGKGEEFINALESVKNLSKQLSGTKKQRQRAVPKYNIAFDNFEKAMQPFMRVNPQLESGQMFSPELLDENLRKTEEAKQKVLETYDERLKEREIGPYAKPFDFSYGEFSNGGIAGLSGGDKSGPPPERGPDSEGLRSLMKRGINL